jgi:predicted TIM-barrel enzyme
MTQTSLPFDTRVIAALHLPDPVVEPDLPMSFLEDYVLTNARVFVEAGITTVKLQDQTRETGQASVQTVARTAALGALMRREFPQLTLGIIVQAHDAQSPLAIAEAAGAAFVRLKVYVGAMLSSEGTKEALCVDARAYRRQSAPGVAILADIHDRTSRPLGGVSQPDAAKWAEQMGADGLVITGSSFADTLARIDALKQAGVRRPIMIGGGIDEGNIAQALDACAGVIVSSALMVKGEHHGAKLRWDRDKCARLIDVVRNRR